MANGGPLLRQVVEAVLKLLTPRPTAGSDQARVRSRPTGDRARTVVYAPDLDGAADPGEIVWAWVPFEEEDGRGKDRPLLVVGRAGAELLGLMLSSQHKHHGAPGWMSIGSGVWDREGRESFVRLDRVLEVAEH
jgi:PemK-like, MazF-like toxin of type II toxin-antitoxin system